MKEYNASTYGEKIAGAYDDLYGSFDEEIIQRIWELAPDGSAFELGIGTGRIAIPLSKRGIKVGGIDSSPSMVDKLRSKPGGEDIPVQIGDFSNFTTTEKYDIVFVVFNTFFALLSQEEQVNCFQCVQKILKDNGKFVIEVFFPDLKRFDRGQTVRTIDAELNNIKLECSRHDEVDQRITTQTVHITEEGIRMYPVSLRYAWPTELDLMGRLTGFELQERWGDWQKGSFTSNSGMHISVFQKK